MVTSMVRLTVAFLLLLATVSVALPSPQTVTTAATWAQNRLPTGWSLVDTKTQPQHVLEFTIAVRLQNTSRVEEELLAIADPRSSRYAQYYSMDEVAALSAPDPAHLSAVVSFIGSSEGVKDVHIAPGGAFVSFKATVEHAETMLRAKYVTLKDPAGNMVVRTPSYRLPEAVHDAVDVLEPTLRLSSVSVLTGSETETNITTPASLRALYGMGTTEGHTASGNSQATANFLGQYYSKSDLDTFFKSLYPEASGRSVSTVIGPNNVSDPGIEAQLDIQYLMSIGGGVPTTFWSTAGQVGENEPFLKWLMDLSSTKQVPSLFSISYADYEDTVEEAYAKRVSVEFAKAGLRGITLISGSGDGGVEGAQPRKCPNGTFVPTFPCSSPFETCVGGTTGGYKAGDVESAVSFSGGGFGRYFQTANYQQKAVEQWHATAAASRQLPEKSLFDIRGRGFPDVAAMGTDFVVVDHGRKISVGGTSASTPTFAGLVSQLNEIRFQAGKPSLGFLNPLLYLHPEAFNDIVSGHNPGCGEQGFYADVGWDPITGLGSPNFQRLSKIVSELP